ncbi:MAG: 16S rRNA (adenine(1518)-N(6)/adenine(1519)-N(6))-dimethyltransferase RsmA [Alphaproteobacteria bacterium]|nr:16S rRNA (adenine(1518)-N(6)/adenine(1519)-N(6))-dimethyltransferase RsmA [Alphaproteobacteria bacterium]
MTPDRRFGQNFLHDRRVVARIAAAAAPFDPMPVIEIGPGPGTLTRALLDAGASRLIAVERDPRCLAALAEIADPRLAVIRNDALEIDEAALAQGPFRVVANLPYNIASVLLIKWLRLVRARPGTLTGMLLMFQKEVAERLVARPGGKTRGRLSVLTEWLCEARIEFDVARGAFLPPPKVTSSVVRLTPRAEPSARAEFSAMEKVVAAAFGQRRKMLRAGLKGLGFTAERLEALGIDPTARAETLDVTAFAALARAL